MTRWNTAPLNALAILALFSVSGVLLSLSPFQAIALSVAWTCVALLLIRSPWVTLSQRIHIANENGLFVVAVSYILSIMTTAVMIYTLDYLSPDVSNSAPIVLHDLAYAIHALICLWSLAFGYIISTIVSHSQKTLFTSEPARPSINGFGVAQKREEHVMPLKDHWVIPDATVLEDGRAFDLAKLGLFDSHFALPSFVVSDLKHLSSDAQDEAVRFKAKKALETLRRLESLPRLCFEIIEAAELHEPVSTTERLYQFAQETHSSIITLDPSLYRSELDGTPSQFIISLDAIASAVRQPIPKGEHLSIRIQRLGKEPKQGIGYLDDGTMVVVNGGGDFLGKTIKTQVLSQKYSSSGKIIFCNAIPNDEDEAPSSASYSQHSSYATSSNGRASSSSNHYAHYDSQN